MSEKPMSLGTAKVFFAKLFGGEHNIPVKVQRCGFGWCMYLHRTMATYDGDMLTRLVFLAHDDMIRVEISGAGGQNFRLAIHPRICREGGRFYERHPTIEAALDRWRGKKPKNSEKRKYFLTDGTAVAKSRCMTKEEAEEANKKAEEATDGKLTYMTGR